MALVVPTTSQLTLLQWLLKDTSNTESLTLRLFSSNTTPTIASTYASFTEATFTGYASKTLTRGNWTAPATVDDVATTTQPEQSWSVGSDQTIYGYTITDSDDVLLWAERFSTPKNLVTSSTFELTPRFELGSAD